ncbi:MAG TPA: ribosome biogenesis GTPase Der [Kofleriaceae bacterium]|nr:ribosome biogenesis GTPase Der [Kofleriaceae bacterium]
MRPRIAIVGRPNVGKSTLFNRMVGGRPALVHDTPGLTRDRRYGELDYFGKVVDVIDTGGLDPSVEGDVIGAGIHRQAWRGIEEADLLVLVVDGSAGVSPLDEEVGRMIRATGKPIVLAVNKIDSPKRDVDVAEFHQLGLGDPMPVSAAHGRGFDSLLEVVADALFDGADDEVEAAEETEVEEESENEEEEESASESESDELDEDLDEAQGDEADAEGGERKRRPWRRGDDEVGPIRVAFVGKPNAGKSSLTNRLLGEERSLVHHEPGTTTDPVDSPLTFAGQDYILVDTAGIRRKARVEEDVEKLSVVLALGQIERADVVVLVIDASLGPSEQDARILGEIEKAGRSVVIALNKADLLRGANAQDTLRQAVKDNFHFISWAPTTMLSASRGDGVDKLMDLVKKTAQQHRRRISTSDLNRFFAEVCEVVPPPVWRGRSVRVYFMTQAAVRPPTFILKASAPEGISPAYRRFLANQLRKRYGFRGTPLRIFPRARDDKKPDGV